jgi:hypothetical protein
MNIFLSKRLFLRDDTPKTKTRLSDKEIHNGMLCIFVCMNLYQSTVGTQSKKT